MEQTGFGPFFLAESASTDALNKNKWFI